jgi:hypothetical protein
VSNSRLYSLKLQVPSGYNKIRDDNKADTTTDTIINIPNLFQKGNDYSGITSKE